MRSPVPQRPAAGVSLVEALVALAIMAMGMLAVIGTQSSMRLNADVARQRSEATRIADTALEAARGFVQITDTGGPPSWAALASAAPEVVTGLSTNTQYTVSRSVDGSADSPLKSLVVTVDWQDREGRSQQVRLSSVLAAAAPELSGALGVSTASSVLRRPLARHPTIPVTARDMGNGTSVFKPVSSGSVAWVFNNATGVITGVCEVSATDNLETLTLENIASCSANTVAQFVSGVVRFFVSHSGPITAAEAEDPPAPVLNLDVRIALTSSGHSGPGWECFDNAPTSASAASRRRSVSYYCIVYANSAGTWSGRATLRPEAFSETPGESWQIGDDDLGEYRVCRYTSGTTRTQVVANTAHPDTYSNVSGNLTNQNFLVVPADNTCPTDGPADPANGDFVSSNTQQLQPS